MLSVKALRLKAFGQTCEDNGNITVLGKLHSFIEKLVNSFVTVGDEALCVCDIIHALDSFKSRCHLK